MNPKIEEVYAVNQEDDDRSSGKPKWWFKEKQEAVEAARGMGWYGSNAPISKHHAIIIDHKIFLLQRVSPVYFGGIVSDREIKTQALKKLSETEKRVLGLS